MMYMYLLSSEESGGCFPGLTLVFNIPPTYIQEQTVTDQIGLSFPFPFPHTLAEVSLL
jgi:hypothetical protein